MDDSGDLAITVNGDQIIVAGEIDASTVGQLASKLTDMEGDIHLDMSAVSFIDSSGIRALVVAHQRAEERSNRMTIGEPSASVRRLFQLSSLDDYFHVA
jgi:anti-sigma B factor antagonist